MERRAAASLYVWFGRFRCARGFLVEIASGELEDSDSVDDGDVALVVVVELDGGDFTFSNSKLYAAAPPPPLLRQADISWPRKKNDPFPDKKQKTNSRINSIRVENSVKDLEIVGFEEVSS